MFSRVDLLKIPNFSRAQIDRTAKEHLLKMGYLKLRRIPMGKCKEENTF